MSPIDGLRILVADHFAISAVPAMRFEKRRPRSRVHWNAWIEAVRRWQDERSLLVLLYPGYLKALLGRAYVRRVGVPALQGHFRDVSTLMLSRWLLRHIFPVLP